MEKAGLRGMRYAPNVRRALNYECRWKGGDRGGLAEPEKKKKSRKEQKLLTRIGLFMEGLILHPFLRSTRARIVLPSWEIQSKVPYKLVSSAPSYS
jgi:hypothetical protein